MLYYELYFLKVNLHEHIVHNFIFFIVFLARKKPAKETTEFADSWCGMWKFLRWLSYIRMARDIIFTCLQWSFKISETYLYYISYTQNCKYVNINFNSIFILKLFLYYSIRKKTKSIWYNPTGLQLDLHIVSFQKGLSFRVNRQVRI